MARVVRGFDRRVMELEERTMELAAAPRYRDEQTGEAVAALPEPAYAAAPSAQAPPPPHPHEPLVMSTPGDGASEDRVSLAPPRHLTASTSCSDLHEGALVPAAPSDGSAAHHSGAGPTTVVHVHLPHGMGGIGGVVANPPAPSAPTPSPPSAEEYASHLSPAASTCAGISHVPSAVSIDMEAIAAEAQRMASEQQKTAHGPSDRERLLEQRVYSLEQQLHDARAVPPAGIYDNVPLARTRPSSATASFVQGLGLSTELGYNASGTGRYTPASYAAASGRSSVQGVSNPPSYHMPSPPPAMPPTPVYGKSPESAQDEESFDALADELRSIARDQLALLETERRVNGQSRRDSHALTAPLPPDIAPALSPASAANYIAPAPALGAPMHMQQHVPGSEAASNPAFHSVAKEVTASPPHVPPSPARALAKAAASDGELQETLRMLHESRADALEQLHRSQARAREDEREQMSELMGELKEWKQQNEKRMKELGTRTGFREYAASPSKPPPPRQVAGPTTPRSYAARYADAKMGSDSSSARASPSRRDDAGWNGSRLIANVDRVNGHHIRSQGSRNDSTDRLSSSNGTSERKGLAAEARALGSRPPLPPPATNGPAAAPSTSQPRGERSLRELQRELESLKSSLSVYLGSGLSG